MSSMSRTAPYRLDDQIGFILRQANQRYAALFANGIGNGLTPTQWAALVRLGETGPCPQNQLGRLTAMDAATIKGVVERLDKRGLIQRSADPDDGRRLLVSLSPAGRAELEAGLAAAREINRQALASLSPQEQETLRALLARLI
ncbi:MarR family transcriptional regulator [Pseudomonas aeruginosa VRFPA05]|nr:MarR family transcriptional regulator [Pseudomonas aeruginosa VRFPA05]